LLALLLLILLARGKLGFGFRYRMLFQGFSPETKYALLIGSPGFIGSIASSFPSMLQFRYTIKAASKQGIQEIIGEVLSVHDKLNFPIASFPADISSSCFANGCFCFKAKLYSRLKKIILFSCLLILVYSTIWTLIFIVRADFVARIFITSSEFLHYARIYLRVPGYTIIFAHLISLFFQLFMIIDKPLISMMLMALFAIISSISSILFYEAKNDDSLRMMYTSLLSDSVTFVIALISFVISFVKAQQEVFMIQTNDIEQPF
jgi:hypothetical protein